MVSSKFNRQKKINLNVILSFLFKGIDSGVQFLIVPVTLKCLNAYEYGIWLTISSILLWINSFDIGLGNGLRNELAKAVAQNDYKLARSMVTTAYGMIFVLMTVIFAIGSLVVVNVNWYTILGTTIDQVPNLPKIIFISFALFCVNFSSKFTGNIYLAMQMPSINNLMTSLGHILALFLILILIHLDKGSLLNVAIAFSVSPIIIYLISFPITFGFVYKDISPRIKCFEKKNLNKLLNTGILFFILQISGLVLFALTNVLVSNLFGPDQVTIYNISYKYFTLVNMLMATMISPVWSAVTDAYTKKDFEWIAFSLRRTKKILLALLILVAVMFALSNFVYEIWIGSSVTIPLFVSLLMAIYTSVIICSTSLSFYLNGMGKMKIQTFNIVFVAILFFPVCFVFSNFWGLYGILLALIFLNIPGLVLNYIQLNKLIAQKANGIWSK